jgi:hypothetical protein
MHTELPLERTISTEEVLGMERLVRMRLINSVSGMKSANLVGTAPIPPVSA